MGKNLGDEENGGLLDAIQNGAADSRQISVSNPRKQGQSGESVGEVKSAEFGVAQKNQVEGGRKGRYPGTHRPATLEGRSSVRSARKGNPSPAQ